MKVEKPDICFLNFLPPKMVLIGSFLTEFSFFFIECDHSAEYKYGRQADCVLCLQDSRDAEVINRNLGVARCRYFHEPAVAKITTHSEQCI